MSLRNKILKLIIRSTSKKANGFHYLDARKSFDDDLIKFSKWHKTALAEPVMVGNMAAEWIAPHSFDKELVILYLHGGGYAYGSIASHRNVVSHFAHAGNAKALLIGYRLAPENPFPAAIDDAVASYEWLLARGQKPQNIVFAGDSSGGGLALAAMMALRDKHLPMPAAAVLVSPWTDLTGCGESMERNKKLDPMVTRKKLDDWAALYLGPRGDAKNPLASPVFGDFTGLPPLLVCVGSEEILYSDAERVVTSAIAAGVRATLLVGEDMMHVWPLFGDAIPEAKKSIQEIGKYIALRAA